MHKVHVVGLGVNHDDLPEGVARCIERAQVLAGGHRLLEAFQEHPAIKLPIKSPLEDVIRKIQEVMMSGKEVVVLADGDPGFYGIGKKLVESLGQEHVVLYPNVTVLQAAAARLKVSWENFVTVSLHGRKDLWPLLRGLVRRDLVAVFTDKKHHPGKIAEALMERGVDTFRMHVFENLEQKEERISTLDLTEGKGASFSPLSFVVLERVKDPEVALYLGLDDDLYLHEKGLITKKEVRAVGLSMLSIQPHNIVWDLGAGCGSVGIEASLLAHEGMVLSVEKEPARWSMIRENIRRMGAYAVEAVHGEMPGCLEALPDPDRIFIGGGIGRDILVLEEALKRLKPGGRIVLHLVLLSSLARVRDWLKNLKYPFDVTQVQVSRSQSLAEDQRLEALNPVFVLCATKPEEV